MITASEAHALMNKYNKAETFNRIDKAITAAAMYGHNSVEITLHDVECHNFRSIAARLMANHFLCSLDRATKVLYIQW